MTARVLVDEVFCWFSVPKEHHSDQRCNFEAEVFSAVFHYCGIPEDIISDRGPQFISRVWKAFMEKLGITVSLTSGFHPQSNGQVKRLNQEIGRYLKTYCVNNQNDWAKYVPWVEYAQNSLKHSATNLTPFQCVLGFQPSHFP